MSVDESDNLHARLQKASEEDELDLGDVLFADLPEEIRELTELRSLRLDGCGLESIPDWIGELRSLEVLDLAENPIARLPASFQELTNLEILGLSSVELLELPESLAALTRLRALVAPDNRISTIPDWIGELELLEELDLGHNPIRHVSARLGELRSLRLLRLWGHELATVPQAIQGLQGLELLDLSRNGDANSFRDEEQRLLSPFLGLRMVDAHSDGGGKLTSLPQWLAGALPHLRYLRVDGHHLSTLPQLPAKLVRVSVASNDLSAFPPSVYELTELRDLDLRDNAILTLPHRVRSMHTLERLDLTGNRLAMPPEVLQGGNASRILDYLGQVEGPTRPLDEAKLLVVGEGAVGKTSLIKLLVGKDKFSQHEPKTEGIEVSRWHANAAGGQIAVNVWDFGGQEIMHATHQFFLTRRSVYVLVVDARQSEEQNRLEYWLKLIQSFSDGSPVIVVGNKTEQSPLDIDERGLQAKYPNIAAIVSTSCQATTGINELTTALTSTIAGLAHVRDVLPATFFEVKSELEQMDDNYVAYDRYEQLCVRHGIDDADSQELLVGFLHDLGTVLCFRDDPRLMDTNILNPQWVTGGVYRILNSHLAAQRKGLLHWTDIDTILNTSDYPPARRSFIIDMMKRFELCYEADTTFLVPDLLTKQEPDTGDWSDALRFEVGYDVLPSSVVSRLIVRMNTLISSGTVWRTGLVLAMDSNRALVKGDAEDAVIRIAVSGPQAGRRGLLTAIRTELRAIGETIPGMDGEERVPIPGRPDVLVPYDHLLNLEATGHVEVVPIGMTQGVGVRTLLDGIEQRAERVGVARFATASEHRPEPADPAAPQGAEPWTHAEGLQFGRFLLVAICVLAAVFLAVALAAGQEALGIIAAAVGALGIIAILTLAASGRMSEQTFLDALKSLLRSPERQKN